MATQLMVDLYGCDAALLNDLAKIREIAHNTIRDIHSEIVEECEHQFEPIGITYIAVITTSHFSIHTWPENEYAAVDIFSCSEHIPEQIAEKLKIAFQAKQHTTTLIQRHIEGMN